MVGKDFVEEGTKAGKRRLAWMHHNTVSYDLPTCVYLVQQLSHGGFRKDTVKFPTKMKTKWTCIASNALNAFINNAVACAFFLKRKITSSGPYPNTVNHVNLGRLHNLAKRSARVL